MVAQIITYVIVLFILLTGFFFLLRTFQNLKTKKLLKNYDEKENPSRRTGEGRQTGFRRGETGEGVEAVPTRPSEPKGTRLFPTTSPIKSREDGEDVGGNKRSVGILQRIRQRRRRTGSS